MSAYPGLTTYHVVYTLCDKFVGRVLCRNTRHLYCSALGLARAPTAVLLKEGGKGTEEKGFNQGN